MLCRWENVAILRTFVEMSHQWSFVLCLWEIGTLCDFQQTQCASGCKASSLVTTCHRPGSEIPFNTNLLGFTRTYKYLKWDIHGFKMRSYIVKVGNQLSSEMKTSPTMVRESTVGSPEIQRMNLRGWNRRRGWWCNWWGRSHLLHHCHRRRQTRGIEHHDGGIRDRDRLFFSITTQSSTRSSSTTRWISYDDGGDVDWWLINCRQLRTPSKLIATRRYRDEGCDVGAFWGFLKSEIKLCYNFLILKNYVFFFNYPLQLCYFTISLKKKNLQ